ncbi:hypothetical protein EDD11_006314 [Mortierella claussenii]|nr:hypothetical protein EDD11_006314 [Mortierella claussenii]
MDLGKAMERTLSEGSTFTIMRPEPKSSGTYANTYLLIKTWHAACFYNFSPAFFKQIHDLIKKFLWDGRWAQVTLD